MWRGARPGPENSPGAATEGDRTDLVDKRQPAGGWSVVQFGKCDGLDPGPGDPGCTADACGNTSCSLLSKSCPSLERKKNSLVVK